MELNYTSSVISSELMKRDVGIEFITDFIKNDVMSSFLIIAFVCWTKIEKVALTRKMSKNNILTSVFSTHEDKYIKHYPNSENILFLLDLDCDNSINLLITANLEKLFAAPYRWLLLTEDRSYYESYEKKFINYNFYVDNNIVLAYRMKYAEYTLMELYKYTKGSNFMESRIIKQWKLGLGFSDKKPRNTPQLSRININGTLIKSTIVLTDNDSVNHLTDYRKDCRSCHGRIWLHETTCLTRALPLTSASAAKFILDKNNILTDRHIDAVCKVNYILTNIIIDFMNGTRNFSIVDTWGYKDPRDNLYTGMFGDLQRDLAEIGGSPGFLTADRVPVFEYIAMTVPTLAHFIFRQPPLSYVVNVFVLPFTTDVWLCSIFLCVIVTILIYITAIVEWRSDLGDPTLALLPSLSEAFMVTLGSVAQQGAPNEPRSGAGKFVMFITLMSLMFLYVSYSANIIALLQSPATNIKTLEDLLKSRLELGADDIVYNRYYFEHATEPIRKAIYEKKIAPKGQKSQWMSLEEGVQKLRKGLFAFHAEPSLVYKFMQESFFESEKCGVQQIKYLELNYPYMTIKKNSTFKEIFKLGFRKLQESGIQSREVQLWYIKKPECQISGGNFVSVGLIDVYGAYLVLGCGIGMSIFFFIVEKLLQEKFCGKEIWFVKYKLKRRLRKP